MKKLKRYIHLYFKYVAMAIKSKLAYRMDAFVGILGFIATNSINFSTLYLTVASVQVIDGYSLANMAFLYGLCLIPKSLDHILSDNLWQLGNRMIRQGTLDKYLIKPLNPLFQIIAETFQYEGFGELILGIVFLCIFGPQQANVTWTFGKVMALILCEFAACWLFFNIKLIFGSLAFWMKRSIALMSTMYNINDFARYPITIFKNEIIKGILLYVIPFSLFMFCPIACIFSETGTISYVFGITMNVWQITGILYAFLVVLFGISFLLWHRGLRRYESAGS